MSLKKRSGTLAAVFLSVFLFASISLSGILFADTNLIVNGDFSSGNANWSTYPTPGEPGNFTFEQGVAKVWSKVYNSGGKIWIYQPVMTSSKNLGLYFDVLRNDIGYMGLSSIKVGADLFMGANLVGNFEHDYLTSQQNFKILDTWYRDNFLKLDFSVKPDFDRANIYFAVDYAGEAWFDNILLTQVNTVTIAEPVWIRDSEMKCKAVWINDSGDFQFSFIYPYRDNNWVKIYDMSGKEVYSVDMPYDNPNIIVDLPEGMYTVKTFTVGRTEPIQTFTIGKP